MTEREMYLAMAQWFREHGFTPEYNCHTEDNMVRGRGCFVTASALVRGENGPKLNRIQEIVVGKSSFAFGLKLYGWTESCTDDAIAACEIAADLAA